MKKHLFQKSLLVLLVVLITCIPQMWAANTYYVYCVPEKLWGDDWSDSGTDWVRVNYQSNKDDDTSWQQASMTKTDLRLDGNDIYKATLSNVWYDGVHQLQFQRMTGSTTTIENTYSCIKSWWGYSGFNNKMYKGDWSGDDPVWDALSHDAYDIYASTTIYFDNTETNWDDVNLHLAKAGYLGYDVFTRVSGSTYWYREYSTLWDDFGVGIFYQNEWGHQSGRIYQNIGTGVVCFTPSSASDYSTLSTTAPVGPKNIAISNNGTTIVRGTGTESDPYVVAPGTTISVQASAEKIDEATTIYYKFNTGSYSSSTTTYTVVSSAVAGTTYSVNATVKTMLSSNSSREFTTSTLYFTTGYPITFDMEGGTGGPSTMYAVYDKTLANIGSGSFPTKSGNGFDGFWTEDDGKGIQVINEKGEWKANVEYYTGAGGKLIRTSATTLYARWMPVGYYVVGDFNNWTGDPAYHKFDEGSTPYTVSFAILKTNPKLVNLRTPIKIRKVNAGSSSGSSNDWYGKNDASEFGKSHTTETGLSTTGSNMTLQVFYNGDYTFNLKTSPSVDLEVLVPVVNQLQIYTNSCDDTKDQYYNWDGEEADNKVTKTLALNRCDFYIKPVWDSYYYGKGTKGGGHTTIDRDHLSATGLGTGDSNEENLKLVADLKGNYTFKYDTVAKSIAVVFPTRYSVSYTVRTQRSGNGTESGANGSLTAVNTDDSNVNISTLSNYVVDGNKVLLTAPSAKSGYEFKGWYKGAHDASDWSKNQITSNTSCTITVAKDTAVYAVYYEPTYTVTVDSTSNYVASGNYGGCVKVSGTKVGSVDNVGVNSYAELTAVPTNPAWRFKTWQLSANASLAGGYALTDKTVRVNATAASQTVTAVFEPRYALEGSRSDDANNKEGMPGWSHLAGGTAKDFVVKSFTAINTDNGVDLECECTLLPNRRYKFKVLDREFGTANRRGQESPDANMPANTLWTLSHTNDVFFWSSGYGSYTFHITKMGAADNYYPSLKIDYPSAFELTLGKKVIYNEDNTTLKNADSEGTVTAHTNENSTGYDITSGQYFASGSQIVFTATPATGYEVEGWYSDADCASEHKYSAGENVTISADKKTLTLANRTTATTVYVKFSEKMTRVVLKVEYYPNGHGEITKGGESAPSSIKVGVHTSVDLGVSPEANYYFAGWAHEPYEPDFALDGDDWTENNASATVSGLGAGRTSGQILIARFRELDKIYFKNWDETANAGAGGQFWDSVYVGFGPNWNATASACKEYHYGADMYGKSSMVVPMERCFPYAPYEEYYVWQAYVPRSVTKAGVTSSVVFFDKGEMRSYEHFAHNKVTYRTDYNGLQDMFVPEHTQTGTYNCDCKYYSNGYWKEHYNLEARGEGYYLQQYKDSKWEEVGEFVATENGYHPTLKYDLRVDNVSGDIKFRIISAGGTYYAAASKITSANFTDVNLNSSGSAGFDLTPTVEGQYTFYIDQTSEKMKLSLNYPVAIGDYRLKHTYQISSTDYYSYSDVIKAANKADDTISMYINMDAATKSLYIQKCTSISANKPVWSTGIAVSNFNNSDGNFDEGTGVYKFAIAVTDASATNVEISGSATPSEIGLYKGNYYIKTDAADGGWANYKQNVMDKNSINFKKDKPETFDYYFCKWIGDAGTNIKCVIANDYCNQLSDTLKGDAVIGAEVQTLPSAGNVRFSYNSYTNTIARAYINGSGNYHSKFLYLEGTSKINVRNVAEAGKTDTIMTDKNNWTYMLDIKAQETARVRLTAKYGGEADGIVQDLIGEWNSGAALAEGNTVEILGGSSESSTWNSIRLLYDFKTNYLMSAWVADGVETGSKALNADVLILRENQDAARQITFTEDEDVLSKVDTVYAALCLTRSWMTEDYTMTTAEDYSRRAFYWVSFPFDVKVSDIFGSIGVYGEDWILQTYNGKKRAEKGFWADSEENWEWMSLSDTLKAGHGYVVTLDLDEFYISNSYGKWINNVEAIYLYFPSISKVNNIKATTVSINLGNPADYECKIERNSRNVKDSYWHCIGAPSFANVTRTINNTASTTADTPGDMPATPDAWTTNLLFVYEWDYEVSYLFPTYYNKANPTFQFKAMHSYLVQYKQEEIEWTSVVAPAASIVARRERNADEIRNCNFKLQLFKGNKLHDQTFVYMSDDEAITNNFEFNYDLSKETSSSHATIWTLTADTIDVAANCMPFSDQTTIIPVGVKTAAAGDYTFTMPQGTNGVGVVLVDNITGSRTNLGLTDYIVNLTKGTFDGRFWLEISPITNTPTGIDNNGVEMNDAVRKVMIDGILYIVKDGVIYDARGARVK